MPVREMKIDDLPQVLQIQKALAFQDWNERQFIAEITADYALCVVYEEAAQFNTNEDSRDSIGASPLQNDSKDILGYAVFHLMGPDSELLSIAANASHQRAGIGTALLNAGLAHLDFAKGDKMFLEVREGNTKARRFYEKHGFEPYAERKKYYADGENAILYQKSK
ncbi:ribosomal-protein-alanine N-acetyltransferase [Fibrobacter sp. UWCM]|uniref:GNAT family N-acetyltransferase n=1 Tax=Fibrobacter sp. UWCM TaxID=1896208 RepID=UPI0009230680|nr:GNAT family N-acetyltransferase [Fibrobacter sp. UWCM]SHG58485.1 ribosomal-protein-alanine N-acetyltransferase [Fibrobacter sp. UWCM]